MGKEKEQKHFSEFRPETVQHQGNCTAAAVECPFKTIAFRFGRLARPGTQLPLSSGLHKQYNSKCQLAALTV